jgi:VWFA-related protein
LTRGRLAALTGLPILLALLVASTQVPVRAAAPRLSIKITAPIDGDFIFGKTQIKAEVKSGEKIPGLRVEFSVGGRLIFIAREGPFECFHDFGDDSRSWVIEAKAVTPDGPKISDTIVTRRLEIHYREEVDRVLVAVSVTDKDRSFIEGLTRESFALLEDNQKQEILEFGVEKRPITLGVLIDTSGSMKEEIGQVQEAAKAFVTTLRPQDNAFIVDFDEKVFLLQDITSDHEKLQEAIEGTDAEGGTALYDALYVSYYKMKPIDGRKAIVALTDGDDTNSSFPFKRVEELTRTHDVIVYAIGLGTSVMDVSMRTTFKQLADDSGGRAFFPRNAEALAGVYEQIAADLRSQYFLTYTATNRDFDGSWRKIRVECDHPEARLKTRRGYYAVRR